MPLLPNIQQLAAYNVGQSNYRDGAGNTVEENSSVFSLIWMH